MNLKTLVTGSTATTFQNPKFFNIFSKQSFLPPPCMPQKHHITKRLLVSSPTFRTNPYCIITTCSQNRASDDNVDDSVSNDDNIVVANESIWSRIVEIVRFSGPATGLWLCGPLMSLIDTVVIGQSSSVELAALGPATVLCDDLGYVFMFLSIATSNLVATALAGQGKDEVQHQISILLFVGMTCGVLMLLFTRFLGAWALTGSLGLFRRRIAFTGAKNVDIIYSANKYVQIRGLAWPAVLIGWVAQSASLGLKDSWGPLKALIVASAINGIGDVVLCTFLGYGIAGAAWATMASQVVAAYMMVEALNNKGYNGFALSVPSFSELQHIYMLAAPVFVLMMSKVAFYALLVYFATSMGVQRVAAHQVMIQMYFMCAVWAEPLAQTAQSFMPELLYGAKRSLSRAQLLLKSLVIVGALSGIILGSIGTIIPWLFPFIFSPDNEIIKEMHKVLVPYFITLCVTPSTSSLEGTLLAGRELKFISLSMSSIVFCGALLLMVLSNRGFGLSVCWWGLAAFQWSRFGIALGRLTSPDGILWSNKTTLHYSGGAA